MILLNKKGDIPSIMVLIIILVVFAVISLFLYQTYSIGRDILQGDAFEGDIEAQQTGNRLEKTGKNLDGIFAILLIVGFITIIITSFFIQSHPLFFAFSLIFGVILIFVSMGVSSFYYNWAQNSSTSGLTSVSSNFPITNKIMNILPLITGIMVVIVLIILLAKRGEA